MCVIEASPRLETRRLVLRAPAERDAQRIAELCGDLDIARMTTRMPHPYSLDDAKSFLAGVAYKDPAREPIFLLEHEDEGPVGMLGFHRNPEDQPELGPEMGYWVGKPFWGRGFATEAAQAALNWAQRTWRRRAVVAGHFPDNPASGRVLTKAGFLYTGQVKRKPCLARGELTDVRMMVWLA
ncbi:MAG: GNAT family N-acetyltransferase [Proteobacteria bacterium]|nr:GNAT family N-acetyltransferase [Pseudomonadota bacterium]